MNIKRYFEYNPELELTVAQIGINKWDWICANSLSLEDATEIMSFNKFDILPVREEAGMSKYFQTVNWGNYSEITLHQIEPKDKIYYRLSFFDLLKRMQEDKSTFYFLTDSKDLLGLISLNNLNCLAVYNYIYQITAGLERTVSSYIRSIANEHEIIEILKLTSDKTGKEILRSYEELKESNAENSIFDHLYFPTLGTILKRLSPNIPEHQKSLLKFRKKFSSNNIYGKLRNDVAHPIKPIFTSLKSVERVNELISDYYEINEILSSQ